MAALIIPDLNFIFVDIPRTASSSISNWIFDRCMENKIKVEEIFGQPADSMLRSYGNYKITAAIRNPYDRLVSWYFYLRLKTEQDGFHLLKDIDLFKVNFDEFVYRVPKLQLDKEKLFEKEQNKPEHLRNDYWFSIADPQSSWLTKDPDDIIRFENLLVDFQKIQNLFQCDIPLYHHKKTDHLPYEKYYNDDLRQFVYDLYKIDFNRWGYSK